MADSGKTDQIQLLEESSFGGGSGTNIAFGYSTSFEWNADAHVTQIYGLENTEPGPAANTDGVYEVTGTHEWFLHDGREFEAIFGTLTDGGGGSFTLDVAATLPSFACKCVLDYTNTEFVKVVGVKYTKFTISMQQGDDPVQVTADWLGRDVEDDTTFTPTSPSTIPFRFIDGKLTVGGGEYADVENVQIEMDRKCVARRHIKEVSSGEKRLITDIVEGPLAITFTGVATARAALLDQLRGGASMTDDRSDTTLQLYMGNGTNTFQLDLTGVRFNTIKRVNNKEEEIAVVEFSGVALDLTGQGTY